MKSIEVKTLTRNYRIYIKNNIRELFCDYINKTFHEISNIILISNEKIYEIYGDQVKNIISKEFKTKEIILKDGEKYKNIDTLKYIYLKLLDLNAHRNDILVPFGGGVVGDTASFAAATFNRGMNLVQYPTTIISQIDSSIGGKTAVNFENTKNIIGCFYQPHLVIIDPEFLKTLEEKEIINGLGEIIKYGLIFDFQIIDDILNLVIRYKNDKDRLFRIVNSEEFSRVIYKCAKIKAEIVEKDEFDLSERHLLNFGHTIGHALEKTIGFDRINHGQAVAMGILCAIDISVNIGYLNKDFKKKITDLYDILKLPEFIPGMSADKILDALKFDKKFVSGKSKFILLEDVNKPKICTDLDEDIIRNSILSNMK